VIICDDSVDSHAYNTSAVRVEMRGWKSPSVTASPPFFIRLIENVGISEIVDGAIEFSGVSF